MSHRRFSIPSLVGGVGRQSSDKRLPTEAENLDNCLVTVEKSIEKRMGTESVLSDITYTEQTSGEDPIPAPGSLVFNIIDSATGERFIPFENTDILYKWISIDVNNRFLIAINFGLDLADSKVITDVEKKKFITVWKLNLTTNKLELQDFDFDSITIDVYNYLSHNPDAKKSADSLIFALFGSALIACNRNVKAGYRDNYVIDIEGNSVIEATGTNEFTVDATSYTAKLFKDGDSGDWEIKVDSADENERYPAFTAAFGYPNGIRASLWELELMDGETSQCRFAINKELPQAERIKFNISEVTVISGTFPEGGPGDTSNGWSFKWYYREQDYKGRELKYRVSALPDTVGKNLVPITLDTQLSTLDEDPRQFLFGGLIGDGSTDGGDGTGAHGGATTHPILHVNNAVDDTLKGNVKDPSAGVAGDNYFADTFFVNRGSIQYKVHLLDYDLNEVPGVDELYQNSGSASGDETNLQVNSFLRPVTDLEFSGYSLSGGDVSAYDVDSITIDETKTLKDLNALIEKSGADAKLSLDATNNTLSIVDASQENLVLTVDGDNFGNGEVGNHPFIESLGLTVTGAQSIKTINYDTKFDGDMVDENQDSLFSGIEDLNNIEIYLDQSPLQSQTSLFTITVDDILGDDQDFDTVNLSHLAYAVNEVTNGEFKLVYDTDIDGTGVVGRRNPSGNIEVEADTNTAIQNIGIKIIATSDTYIPKNSVPFVRDAVLVGTTGDSEMAKRLGIRHKLEDYKLVVEDNNYDVSTQTELGQSIVSFQNIAIPPSENDTIKNNNAHDTLYSLYDNGPLATDANIGQDGRGKVYQCRERFFDFISGFYRTVNEPDGGNPYYERIRAEDKFSVPDEKTWPFILDYDTANNKWKFVTPPWTPRLGGSITNNPGPSILVDPLDPKKRIRKQINAITVWRNRLWFAVDDTIFSSQFGNFFNLYLNDPTTVVDTDVIDVRSSIDKVSKINSMLSFYDYLFINTDNDVQFELQGSENQVTPFTAELSPTTFYSTDPVARPQLLGSQIYFFAPSKIYLYYSNANTSNITQAIEVTQHAEYYLPTNFGAISRAPAQDTILMVDDDAKNNLYLYTNRFSGDKVIQNSLFRYIFEPDVSIIEMEVFDNYLYMVLTRTFNDLGNNPEKQYFVERVLLESPDVLDKNVPRIDGRLLLEFDGTDARYDSVSDTTTFTLPVHDPFIDTVVLGPSWNGNAFRSVPHSNKTDGGKFTKIITPGKYIQDLIAETFDYQLVNEFAEETEDYSSITAEEVESLNEDYGLITEDLDGVVGSVPGIYFGRSYLMNAELSRQFLRDQNQQIIDGNLNLRTITTRYFNTGSYDIVVQRRDNEDQISITTKRDTFYKEGLYNQTKLDQPARISEEGEFMAKVYGNSENMRVFIQSKEFTPCNITNIEFKGIFKQQYRSGQN